ncbi:MAG: secondary thiamine-phosphate synthase enzyme YjbQ [Synergistetes bacterium]|nr:secondary thiamine-phosphate synthase enzyme YjbQ [Synergistota bacterium]MCX8127936.1 secondary thiamine-phosphate synthase enzyme YjbQ [Synergistota bacterium]MDW8192023.1 secondary thiamine-phosphate synthase enzyme YjbQ [Synergistota bacterium]
MAGAKRVINLRTSSKEEFIDITDKVNQVVKEFGARDGFCFLFVPHTTGAVFVNEGYDPSVLKDIGDTLRRLIPSGLSYSHLEGNSHAHIRSSIVGVSLLLPVENGKISLGKWQSVFFAEFDGPRSREVWVWLL